VNGAGIEFGTSGGGGRTMGTLRGAGAGSAFVWCAPLTGMLPFNRDSISLRNCKWLIVNHQNTVGIHILL
jgi:hypothetical protein